MQYIDGFDLKILELQDAILIDMVEFNSGQAWYSVFKYVLESVL